MAASHLLCDARRETTGFPLAHVAFAASRDARKDVIVALANDIGSGQVLLFMLEFFFFIIWIWLLIVVFSDIFRSHDIGGFAKAIWVLFVIILPYLGVLVYLIARGHKMSEHAQQAAQAQDAAFKQYVQQAAGSGSSSPSEELARLADLKAKGVIDDAEFARLKSKVVTG
jgi:Phospholipase_D-nuclease N-terminal/Short C-terminal domain